MTTATGHYLATEKIWASLFLAMPDHLRALLSFPRAVSMEAVLRDWKRYVAKQTGIVLQEGFFDNRLGNNESLGENATYIRLNSVRAGLVLDAKMWNFDWPDYPVAPTRQG